ncbi:hypothetical protein H4Q32_029608 [Labeo rohita]|uniref:Uncharacterized protein n=1 Tax=Labeo rohita TaxID=84645 RepID=A0ABQ8L648_LABRO|nr:hypothetical protein H4Q32_029608 [Labeo rohita]
MAAKEVQTADTNMLEIMEKHKKHEKHGTMETDEHKKLNLETENISEDSDVSEQFSDEDSLEMGDSNLNIARDIASWSMENGIAHNAIDSLLKLLKKHGTKDLPSCSRTLLDTPKAVNIQQKSGMEYFYFGVEKMLKNQRQQEGHHNGEQETPLCQLNINMVTAFPIDYLHQACLGVMKKLVLTWMRGPKETRMSAGHINIVSSKIENPQNSIPNVFARRPRGLDEIDRWKATEYRQLMLYTGKTVLKGLLKQELYDNFLCFSTAMCILVQPSLTRKHWEYARDLLKFFVLQCRELYGEGKHAEENTRGTDQVYKAQQFLWH